MTEHLIVAEVPGVLKFAVVSGATAAAKHLDALAGRLATALGRPVEGQIFAKYGELADALAGGAAQIVWAPPRVASGLHHAGHGTIALGCKRGGALGFHSALFTRHTSKIETLEDLRGCHVAWVDPESSAGYRVPRKHMVDAGLDPETIFGKQSLLGTHERVAVAVLAGEADVGATYVSLDPKTSRPLSAGWLEAGAAVNGAFIVATAGPIPPDVIVLSNRLSPELRERIVVELGALSRAAPEAIGGLFGAEALEPPDLAAFAAP